MLIVSAGLMSAALAMAKDTVYVGGAYIAIHSEMAPLQGDISFPSPGAYFKVSSAQTLMFGWEHYLTENIGVDFALGLPPKHKSYGQGIYEGVGVMSTSKEMCPTVFVNYHFTSLSPNFVPLVGVGVNYTKLTTKPTEAGTAAAGYPVSISNSSYVGLAYQVGLEYKINSNWSILGKVAVSDVKSDLTLTIHTPVGDMKDKSTVHFNPVVSSLALAYSF